MPVNIMGGELTQILNVFVSNELKWRPALALACARAIVFVDNNSIGRAGTHKGGAIIETSPSRRSLEGNIGQRI